MELKRNAHYDGFETNFERDIKKPVQIDQFIDEIRVVLDSLQWNIKQG